MSNVGSAAGAESLHKSLQSRVLGVEYLKPETLRSARRQAGGCSAKDQLSGKRTRGAALATGFKFAGCLHILETAQLQGAQISGVRSRPSPHWPYAVSLDPEYADVSSRTLLRWMLRSVDAAIRHTASEIGPRSTARIA